MDSTRPIRALLRGLEALAFLNMSDGATVSEVAHEIHLPRTTVYRILATLCSGGFVYRDCGDERYRLTIRVRELSGGFDDEAWVANIAKPLLDELCNETIWPVSLATLSGTEMIWRVTTDQRSPLTIERFSTAERFPLLTSAQGRVYLANCAPAQCAALIDSLGRSGRDEDRASHDRPALQRLLAEIRAQGFALASRPRRQSDEVSISVPVQVRAGTLASLGVRFDASAMAVQAAIERFLPLLRHCAAKISTTISDQRAEAGRHDSPKIAA